MANKNSRLLLVLCFCTCLCTQIKAQTQIKSFEEFLAYATSKSLTLQNGDIQLSQAKKAQLAALLSVPDPNANLAATYTNNTQLPVSVFPGEILGGQPGTYKEVTMGVQYVSNANFYADIKLINPQGWEKLRLAKINIDLTEGNNKIAKKNLYENIAQLYFNIVTLQEQHKATQSNLRTADTLYQITQKKFEEGLLKQQEVNDSKVNLLQVEESLRQIQFLLSQQYLSLKILCDIPASDSVQIVQQVSADLAPAAAKAEVNPLLALNAAQKKSYALASYRQALYGNFPVLSFFASSTRQQFNQKARLFDNNVRWIPSSYIGIKLSIPLPSANSISQLSAARHEYLIAGNNAAQARIKSELTAANLQSEYEKSFSQLNSHREILALHRDSYRKNLLNFSEGIGSLEQTLRSFNAMVNSDYQLISSAIQLWLTASRISINNNIR